MNGKNIQQIEFEIENVEYIRKFAHLYTFESKLIGTYRTAWHPIQQKKSIEVSLNINVSISLFDVHTYIHSIGAQVLFGNIHVYVCVYNPLIHLKIMQFNWRGYYDRINT